MNVWGGNMKLWRFMQKEKGTISIFMAVIMLSMVILTSVFVDGSRIRSAETIVQSASDSAIRSVIAKYDKDLKDRYGLFTLEEEDQDAIKQDYLKFLAANLSASVPGADDTFHKYLERIMQYASGEAGQDILDLYDFQTGTEGTSVLPAYSIIEPDVLQKQMVEFAKYRSAFAVGDLFDLGDEISKKMKEAEVNTENLEITMKSRESVESVMQDSYTWAEKLQEKKLYFDGSCSDWSEGIGLTESRAADLRSKMEEIKKVYQKMEKEEDSEETEKNLEELKKDAKEIYSTSKLSLNYYKKQELEQAITDLKKLKTELEGLKSEGAPFLQRISNAEKETQNSKSALKENGTKEVTDNLKNDADQMCEELKKLKKVVEENQTWLENTIKRVDDGIKKLEPIPSKITSSLAEADSEAVAQQNIKTLTTIESSLKTAAACFKQKSGKVEQYKFEDKKNQDLAENLGGAYKSLKKTKFKSGNDIENPAVISAEKKAALPSVMYRKSNTYHTNDKYKEMDEKYTELVKSSGGDSSATDINLEKIDGENTEQTLGIIKTFLNFLGDMATDATNSVVTDFYTMGMFNGRTTKSVDYWKQAYADSGTSGYEGKPYDRERTTEPDKNLRFEEKANYSHAAGNSFMDAELEYIIVGDMNEKNNADSVYARIFGMRMGFNTIAVFADAEWSSIATAAASFTGPFAPVVKVAIMLTLALVETYLDMYFLIDKGFKIPLMKNECLTLSTRNLAEILANTGGDKGVSLFSGLKPAYTSTSIMNDYETYLYFLLLLENRETKLLRMADVIQLNMQVQTGDDGYCMADHYTAVRAETEATIKPMMMGLPFVPSDMKENGRYKIKTMIYEGY